MASFFGRQTAVNQGTTRASATAVAGPSACLKSCEKVMNQCLVDATTFMEKERCRDRYDICSGKCGAMGEPAVTQAPVSSPTTTGPLPGVSAVAAPYPSGRDRPRPEPEPRPKPGPGPSPSPSPSDDCKQKHITCIQGCEQERGGGRGQLGERRYEQCVARCDRAYDRCLVVPPPPGQQLACRGGKCVQGTPGTIYNPEEYAACAGKKVGDTCALKICNLDTDCPAGYICVGGKCVPGPGACVEGKTCTDSKQCAGEACINGKCHCTGGGCKDDAYCIKKHGAGWYCYKTAGSDRGICKQKGAGECTPGKRCTGPEKSNPQCGGAKCFRPKFSGDESVAGTCYCKGGDGDGDGDGLGEYQWPSNLTDLYNQMMGKAGDYLNMDLPDYALSPELQSLLDQLLGRAGEYLGRKPGYSQSALEAMFGKNYENIRNLGTLTRQQTESGLQREGMLGTGAGQAALRQIPWQTEKNVSDVVRDVFLGNEDQKRKDLEAFTNMASGLFGQGVGVEQMVEAINAERRREERDYTGIANTLFGSGMTYNQLQEAINAARRGEGQNALALYLQYVVSLMNSWKS